MTVFMCVNGEGWSEVMYATQRAIGGPGPPTYFVILTLLGGFFVVNLFLAVLWETYSGIPPELTPSSRSSSGCSRRSATTIRTAPRRSAAHPRYDRRRRRRRRRRGGGGGVRRQGAGACIAC